MIKNPPASVGDVGLIPGFGRYLGGRNGNPPLHSCLENSMNTGAWQAQSMVLQRVGHGLVTELGTGTCLLYAKNDGAKLGSGTSLAANLAC